MYHSDTKKLSNPGSGRPETSSVLRGKITFFFGDFEVSVDQYECFGFQSEKAVSWRSKAVEMF